MHLTRVTPVVVTVSDKFSVYECEHNTQRVWTQFLNLYNQKHEEEVRLTSLEKD